MFYTIKYLAGVNQSVPALSYSNSETSLLNTAQSQVLTLESFSHTYLNQIQIPRKPKRKSYLYKVTLMHVDASEWSILVPLTGCQDLLSWWIAESQQKSMLPTRSKITLQGMLKFKIHPHTHKSRKQFRFHFFFTY